MAKIKVSKIAPSFRGFFEGQETRPCFWEGVTGYCTLSFTHSLSSAFVSSLCVCVCVFTSKQTTFLASWNRQPNNQLCLHSLILPTSALLPHPPQSHQLRLLDHSLPSPQVDSTLWSTSEGSIQLKRDSKDSQPSFSTSTGYVIEDTR